MANMTNSEFTKLLTQTAKAANKHFTLLAKVNDECIARYGVSYTEVDADGIIDTLDQNGGYAFTEKQFHEAMLLSNCERLDLIADKLRKLPSLTTEERYELEEIQRKLDGIN